MPATDKLDPDKATLTDDRDTDSERTQPHKSKASKCPYRLPVSPPPLLTLPFIPQQRTSPMSPASSSKSAPAPPAPHAPFRMPSTSPASKKTCAPGSSRETASLVTSALWPTSSQARACPWIGKTRRRPSWQPMAARPAVQLGSPGAQRVERRMVIRRQPPTAARPPALP